MPYILCFYALLWVSVFSDCVAQMREYWQRNPLLITVLLFDVPQCPVCQREFVSAEYLQSHIHRRHPEHLSLARREEEEKKK